MLPQPLSRVLIGLWAALFLCSCAAEPPASNRYVFYLHGAIVEQQGPGAVSERFGRYEYEAILSQLRQNGLIVVSEVRPPDSDVREYAEKVAAQVQRLIERGVPPSHITVIGASKGSVIASLASTRLRSPTVRYVLMATCNDWLVETFDPKLTGEVLAIHEQSDELAGSCQRLAGRSPELSRFEEIRLETGLGHGFLYRPLPEWMVPAVGWAKR